MSKYLHVYRAPSGQWAGILLDEFGGIAGCESPAEVLDAAREQFPEIQSLPKGTVPTPAEWVEIEQSKKSQT